MKLPGLGVLGISVPVEQIAVNQKGKSDDHERHRDDDNGDGGGRGFLLAAVVPAVSSRGELLSGLFHGDGQLPAEDEVAEDEAHAGKDGVEDHVDPDPHTHPEPLVGDGAERALAGRAFAQRHHVHSVQRVRVEQGAHGGDDEDGDDTFVTCAHDVDAVGPDDGGGSLGGESHQEPGGQRGRDINNPDDQFAHDRVTGVGVIIQHLPCPHRQSPAVQHGGVGQGQGGQVNVHG